MENKSPNQAANELVKILSALDSGRLVPDLTQKLKELAKLALGRSAEGSLTLKISIKPNQHASNGIKLSGAIAFNEPKKQRSSTDFFFDDEFGLVSDDPNQLKLSDFLGDKDI